MTAIQCLSDTAPSCASTLRLSRTRSTITGGPHVGHGAGMKITANICCNSLKSRPSVAVRDTSPFVIPITWLQPSHHPAKAATWSMANH